MRSPFYWLKRENRDRYADSVAKAARRAGIVQAKAELHRKGLLTPESEKALNDLIGLTDEIAALYRVMGEAADLSISDIPRA